MPTNESVYFPQFALDNERRTSSWTPGTFALFRQPEGTDVLLEAMAILRDQGKDVRLRAAGLFETEEYERQLEGQGERLNLVDAIEWTGFTKDVVAELVQMDLFVLPSLFGEGLPMVVLESMAAGAAEDLAKAIARVMDGELDWADARSSALERHGEHFSDFAMASGVAKAYEKVLYN